MKKKYWQIHEGEQTIEIHGFNDLECHLHLKTQPEHDEYGNPSSFKGD